MDLEITLSDRAAVNAHFGTFEIKTDQPIQGGGDGTAPSPFDLFIASIGTCAGYYVLSYCHQHGLPTHGIKILQHVHRDPVTHMVAKIDLVIKVPADFPMKHADAVIRSANLCAVKKHLEHPPTFETTLTSSA
jgi:putative redox protein